MVALFNQLHNTPNTTGPTHPNIKNLSDCSPKTHHQEILTSNIQEKVILLPRGAVRITSRDFCNCSCLNVTAADCCNCSCLNVTAADFCNCSCLNVIAADFCN
uniref:Uncharacterized protein n=1 Tax=Timema cristinae TaxID=61476 RepID=A0A7R9DNI8_TIMCR|nr:unnamed protein product [Timema cristinae]